MSERDYLLKTPCLQSRLIQDEVCRQYGLTRGELVGPGRARKIAWPRQEVYWRLRTERQLTLSQIASVCGRTDHQTILHGIKAHEKRRGG